MVAYWIASMGIDDPAEIAGYSEQASVAVAKYGGRFLSRAGGFRLLEGTIAGDRCALIEFKDMDTAVACYNSPEYQKALSFREGKAEAVFFVIDGTDA
ncbi:MAG: DUF1330 domain-containing protein [Rhodospirillaceae bacterium]